MVFSAEEFDAHEQVVFCHDPASGLRAIIAIHSTARGPALGGCRMWSYPSEQAALTDVLRLSRGMTYKNAMAGLDLGGGKAVIIGDPRRDKSEQLFLAMGQFVESLGGRYIIAEDVGTAVADMQVMRRVSRWVGGLPEKGGGDPSPATAWGVFHGMRAALRHRTGSDDMAGLTVAVQGCGSVGRHLMRHLVEAGVRLIVTDIHEDSVRAAVAAFGADAVAPDAIYDVAADIFAPCALGAILNERTIRRLKARIVAGSANNQLARPEHGWMLLRRGILYAPDYVINAGGVIDVSQSGPGYDRPKALEQVARIHDTLLAVFARADAEKLPTSEVADAMARVLIARPPAANQAKAA